MLVGVNKHQELEMPYCLTCGNKKFNTRDEVARHILDNKSDHTPAGIKWAQQILKIEPAKPVEATFNLGGKEHKVTSLPDGSISWESENLNF